MELHNSITNWKAIKSFNTLEERFNKLHNNTYDYSKSVYTKSKGKLIIICPIHGEFTKTPDEHLEGQGCPKCSKKLDADNLRFTVLLLSPDSRPADINPLMTCGLSSPKNSSSPSGEMNSLSSFT